MKNKQIFAVFGCVAGVLVLFLPALAELEFHAKALGILCWAIIWWIAKILPEYVTALIMEVLLVVIAGVPSQTVFSAFSGSTWWLLLAAFGLSLGMVKSGLLHRISVKVLGLFPRSFRGQTLGLMVVGTITAPLIPGLSAKAAMLAPLSLGISDSMNYPRKGTQSTGMFLSMLVGLRNPAPLFISASILGYTFMGQYPPEIQAQFTMLHWFICALPWFLCVSVLNYIALITLYSPGTEERYGPKDPAPEKLGAMSKAEKQILAIMIVTVTLWITEPLHGISSHIIAIAALTVCLALDIFDRNVFRSDINWDSLVFIGIALSLSSTFSYLGIDQWIVGLCAPAMQKLAVNPYLLVLGIGILTVFARFVIVSEVAYVNIFMVFMVPVAMRLGINPWIIGMAAYALVNPWFVMYQNPVYMAAYYAVDGQMAEHNTVEKYCLLYVLICLIGLVISVPYWIHTGVFYLH